MQCSSGNAGDLQNGTFPWIFWDPEKMKEIVNDITSSLKKPMSRSYVFEYPNDGGISEITDFEYSV